MCKNGKWSLSPAFDLTYSFDPSGKWTKVHQISLNGKQDNFTEDDIVSFGNFCDLSKKESISILSKITSVFMEFDKYAKEYKVGAELKKTVLNNLRVKI